MIDIKKINGNEIIDFINSIVEDVLWDYSIQSVEFDSQSYLSENTYVLYFTYTSSGWGSNLFYDNKITITTEGSISVIIKDGPIEGNGCDDEIKTQLLNWISSHEFKDNSEYFYILTKDLSKKISDLQFNETDKIDSLIENLKIIKSYMK